MNLADVVEVLLHLLELLLVGLVPVELDSRLVELPDLLHLGGHGACP